MGNSNLIKTYTRVNVGAYDGTCWGVEIGPDGLLYVGSSSHAWVGDPDGTTLTQLIDGTQSGYINRGYGLDFDSNGDLLLGSFYTDIIARYSTADGSFMVHPKVACADI